MAVGFYLMLSALPFHLSQIKIASNLFCFELSAFSFSASLFRILNSQFLFPHSDFPIPTSEFSPLLPPFPLPENNPDRRFIQAGFFPQLVDQVSFVGKMNSLGVVDKAYDRGWFGGCLDGIVKLDAFAAVK